MSDENENEVVFGLGAASDFAESVAETRSRGLRAAKGVHVRGFAGGFVDPVQILRGAGEALVVVRFAAQSGDDDVVCGGAGVEGAKSKERQ